MNRNTLGGMAYCKHTGKPLPTNLYNDPKGRPGVYRYRRPDGSYKTVRLPYAKAVDAARSANARREAPEGTLVFWVEQYSQWALDQDPARDGKTGWRDRQRQLENFAKEWNHLRPSQMTVPTLSSWWDALTYDQQHNRRSHFSAFFIWALGKGVVKENPFSFRDDVARLIEKKKPMKQRLALSLEEFWLIYEDAAPFVQVAMLVSLTTTMRIGDVVELRFDDVVNGQLCRTIKKSVGQRGATAAAHLSWSLTEHEELKRAIGIGRELSMKHRRCPYIVSRPKIRDVASGRLKHMNQCLPDHVSKGFTKARKAAGVQIDAAKPASFHEIRGLAISLLLNDGKDMAAVQRLAAHTDPSTTSAYTAGQAPHYMEMRGLVVGTKVQK
jgi:integrase